MTTYQPKTQTQSAADIMRRGFFEEFWAAGEIGELCEITNWDDIPPTEKTAWIKAFEFAYSCGYTAALGSTP